MQTYEMDSNPTVSSGSTNAACMTRACCMQPNATPWFDTNNLGPRHSCTWCHGQYAYQLPETNHIGEKTQQKLASMASTGSRSPQWHYVLHAAWHNTVLLWQQCHANGMHTKRARVTAPKNGRARRSRRPCSCTLAEHSTAPTCGVTMPPLKPYCRHSTRALLAAQRACGAQKGPCMQRQRHARRARHLA
jgi:hypothetical protein